MNVGRGLLFWAWRTLFTNTLISIYPFYSGISLLENNKSISSSVKAILSPFIALLNIFLSNLDFPPFYYSYFCISFLIFIPWCFMVVPNLRNIVSAFVSTANSYNLSMKFYIEIYPLCPLSVNFNMRFNSPILNSYTFYSSMTLYTSSLPTIPSPYMSLLLNNSGKLFWQAERILRAAILQRESSSIEVSSDKANLSWEGSMSRERARPPPRN